MTSSTTHIPLTKRDKQPPDNTAVPIKLPHALFTQKWIYTILLGLSYVFLFQNFEIGLNALIFDVLLLVFFIKTEPDIKSRPLFTIAAAGLLISSLSVVIVNSWTASIAHIISMLLLFGIARVREIRFIWFGLMLGVLSIFRAPLDYLAHWKRSLNQGESGKKLRLRFFLIPILISVPFLVIYYQANASFATLVDYFFNWGSFVSSTTVLLFIWGSWLAAAMLFPYSRSSYLAKYDEQLHDNIPRRGKKAYPLFLQKANSLSLTYEYRLARFTLLGLNGLLLLVNLSDILGLTLFRRAQTAAEFSQAIHSGTYLLILSILFAIAVVAFFFRGLLNYYPKVTELRKLAFIWIAQNGLLALFLLVRNLLYVQHSGLAFGRILVFFWLALIMFGLYSLYRKVDRRLSLSYLLHANGMAAWLGLLLLGAVNWDGIITRYNIATQSYEAIDYHYLINDLGDGNAFLLAQDPKIGKQYYSNHARYLPKEYNNYNLSWKLDPNHHTYSDWRSWNYADYRNHRITRKNTFNK